MPVFGWVFIFLLTLRVTCPHLRLQFKFIPIFRIKEIVVKPTIFKKRNEPFALLFACLLLKNNKNEFCRRLYKNTLWFNIREIIDFLLSNCSQHIKHVSFLRTKHTFPFNSGSDYNIFCKHKHLQVLPYKIYA